MKKFNKFLFIDFETYYDTEYSLRKMSPPEYILDDRFQPIMLAAYEVGWPAPRIIEAEAVPDFLKTYVPEETVCCSHNALFDLSILSWRYGFVAGRLADTLGMARALRTFPRYSLGAVAKGLFGADTKGDILGKVKGMDRTGIKRAGLWPAFCSYAIQDVRLCVLIYNRLAKEFPVDERKIMDLVLRCAVTPVLYADSILLEHHLNELRARKARLLRECGYDKAALMSQVQFQKALEGLGVEIKFKTSPTGKWIPQFSKTDPFMSDLLDYGEAPDDDTNYAVQTLAAARLSHKSTIEETRAQRFLNIARLPWRNGGGTLPVALRYGGAHTHRLSGEWQLNMQNLPRDRNKSKLREALVAAPGCSLITADLAQIEARIVAVLAEEGKLVEQFRRGEDVYAQFASIVFHRMINKQTDPAARFLGKSAILGLQYGCGHERFCQMVITQARAAGIPLEGLFDSGTAQHMVNAYRTLYARIPQTWRKLDYALSHYIDSHHPTQTYSWPPVTFSSGGILLPNGLHLRYTIGDERIYGAKLLENITQALARIVVMEAALRLKDRGYRFVLQAHDELCFMLPNERIEAAKVIILEELTRPPAWLPTLPLATEIGVGKNYGSAK